MNVDLKECPDYLRGFITYMRGRGISALSDGEIYQAFDLCYDYDIYSAWRGFLTGKSTLANYCEAINRQEYIYPENYVKLRFLENHDQPRAAFLIPNELALLNWTAFSYFQKGMTLIYAGQEYAADHTPGLFDKDTVDFSENAFHHEMVDYMKALANIKRDPIFTDSIYSVRSQDERFLIAAHEKDGRKALGVFSVKGETGYVEVDFPDGIYTNLINGDPVEVFRGGLQCVCEPIILIR